MEFGLKWTLSSDFPDVKSLQKSLQFFIFLLYINFIFLLTLKLVTATLKLALITFKEL